MQGTRARERGLVLAGSVAIREREKGRGWRPRPASSRSVKQRGAGEVGEGTDREGPPVGDAVAGAPWVSGCARGKWAALLLRRRAGLLLVCSWAKARVGRGEVPRVAGQQAEKG